MLFPNWNDSAQISVLNVRFWISYCSFRSFQKKNLGGLQIIVFKAFSKLKVFCADFCFECGILDLEFWIPEFPEKDFGEASNLYISRLCPNWNYSAQSSLLHEGFWISNSGLRCFQKECLGNCPIYTFHAVYQIPPIHRGSRFCM